MSETQTIKMGEQYRTIMGEEVVLYCTDAPGDYPVHGRVMRGNESYVCSWLANGRRAIDPNVSSTEDLVPAAKRLQFSNRGFIVVMEHGEWWWQPHPPKWRNEFLAVLEHPLTVNVHLVAGKGRELCKRGDS